MSSRKSAMCFTASKENADKTEKVQKKKRLSCVPSLSLNTASIQDKKKAHLSFSEEFHETIKEVEIEVDLYTGAKVPYKTITSETIGNIIKYFEAHYNLPKNKTSMTYNESYLLPCLSLCDIPGLLQEEHPTITSMLNSD